MICVRSTRDRSPRLGIDHFLPQSFFYLIIASIPFFRLRQLPGPAFMKIDWLLTGAVLAIALPALLALKKPPDRLRADLLAPFLVFLVVSSWSAILSPYPEQAMGGLLLLGQMTVFILVALLLLNDNGVRQILPWVLGVSVGVNAFFSIIGYYFSFDLLTHEGSRAFGATISANNMALMCVFTLPLMFFQALHAPTRARRSLGAILTVLIVLGVFSTVSRAGFLILVFVFCVLAVQYRQRLQPRNFGLFIGAIGVALATIVVVVPESFFERQATLITEGTRDQSLDRRSTYLQVGAEAFFDRPLIGWGPDTFKRVWAESEAALRFDRIERPAHNTYVEVAVAGGIVGLAAFGLLLWRAYRNFADAQRILARHGSVRDAALMGAYKASFVSLLAYFLFKSGLDHKYFLLSIPLSYAALSAARRQVGRLTHGDLA